MATMTKTNTQQQQQQQQQQTPTRDKENSANREKGPSPGNAWDQGRGSHPLGSYTHNAPKKTGSKHKGRVGYSSLPRAAAREAEWLSGVQWRPRCSRRLVLRCKYD